MKKLSIICFSLLALSRAASAQTTANFENIVLMPDSFWDGRYDLAAGGVASGNAFFTNRYDTAFKYWADGFMVSNRTDSTTSSSANAFSKLPVSITGKGYNSASYAIGTQGSVVRLTGAASGKQVSGFYVNNTNYNYLSMRNGDLFAKKFGGTSGNDSDYFRMTVFGYLGSVKSTDSVVFYLADYRSSNNSQDYIISDWTWVNLLPLGNVDSIRISLSSSDNDSIYGMNTPAYFCMDDFITRDAFTGVSESAVPAAVSAYPNPSSGIVTVEAAGIVRMTLMNLAGEEMSMSTNENRLDLANLAPGMYLLQVETEEGISTLKLIRQ